MMVHVLNTSLTSTTVIDTVVLSFEPTALTGTVNSWFLLCFLHLIFAFAHLSLSQIFLISLCLLFLVNIIDDFDLVFILGGNNETRIRIFRYNHCLENKEVLDYYKNGPEKTFGAPSFFLPHIEVPSQ